MKSLVFLSVLALAMSNRCVPIVQEVPDSSEVMEMIGGFLYGIDLHLSSNDIQNCVGDDTDIATAFQTAYINFTRQTVESVRDSLAALSHVFGTVSLAISRCSAANVQTITEIQRACSKFKDPASLAFHTGKSLDVEGVQIFDDISGAMHQWEAMDYNKCGYHVGQAMLKVLQTSQTIELGSTNVFDIVEGLLEGTLIDLTVSEVQSCIQDTQSIETDLKAAVTDLGKSMFANVQRGLKLLGEAFKTLPADITLCQANTSAAAKDLETALKVFQAPFSLVWVPDKSLVLDGCEVYTELSKAVADWTNQHYLEFGRDLGKALLQFFKHE